MEHYSFPNVTQIAIPFFVVAILLDLSPGAGKKRK